MNYTLITIGLIFFLNPTYGIYDILPDLLGALFVAAGIGRSACLDEKLERALKLLWIITAGSAVRCVLSLFWQSFDGTAKMLCCFCLALFDAVLLAYFFACFAAGLENIKIRYGTVFDEPAKNVPGRGPEKKGGGEKYDVSKLSAPLSLYTLLRCIVFFLPEATEIRLAGKNGAADNLLLTPYKGLLYGTAFVIIIVPAVFALIRVIGTMRHLSGDRAMSSEILDAAERKKAENPHEFAVKKMKSARVLFLIASVFSLYFFADDIDYIPKAAAAVFFAVLAFYISDVKWERYAALAAAVLLAVLSAACILVSSSYFSTFSGDNSIWLDSAHSMYTALTVLSAFQAAVLLFLLLLSLKLLKRCSDEEIMLRGDGINSYIKDLLAKSRRKYVMTAASAALLCVTAALHVPLRPQAEWMTALLSLIDAVFIISAWALN